MKRAVLALLLLLPLACSELNTGQESPTSPTKNTKANKVEFRAFGSGVLNPVNIKHTDPLSGTTLFSGVVPYQASVTNNADSIFLFMEAVGFGTTSSSTLQVQIFVDGKLFRETVSQGFTLIAQASGTYRRD